MRALVVLLVGALVVGCSSNAAQDSAGEQALAPSAQASVHLVSRGVPPDDVVKHDLAVDAVARLRGRMASLGLEAFKDGAVPDVGDAIPVFETQETGSEASIGDRLGEPQSFLVPLRSGGQVVSAVTMRRGAAGTWEVATVGRVKLAGAIERVRARLSAEGGDPSVGLVVAHGPEVYMLVREKGGKRVFTALRATASAGLPVEQDVEQSRVDAALRLAVAH